MSDLPFISALGAAMLVLLVSVPVVVAVWIFVVVVSGAVERAIDFTRSRLRADNE